MATGLIRSIPPLQKITWYTRQQIDHFCWIWKPFIESVRDGEVEGDVSRVNCTDAVVETPTLRVLQSIK